MVNQFIAVKSIIILRKNKNAMIFLRPPSYNWVTNYLKLMLELLEFNHYYYYQSVEKEIEWKDEEIQKLVESNVEFNQFILNVIERVIEYGVDTCGGQYGGSATFSDDQLGFDVYSGYSESMIDETEPEGYEDATKFYDNDFIEKLNSYNLLKGIKRENFSEYLDFKLTEGSIWYFRIFNFKEDKWIDSDKIVEGDKIVNLFFDLFYYSIYSNEEFNVVNDKIEFTQGDINYITEAQTSMQDEEFIPLTDIFDLDDLKNDFSKLPEIKN